MTTRYNTRRPCPRCSARTSVVLTGEQPGYPGEPDGACHVYLHPMTGHVVARCRGCREWVRVEPVRGTFNPRASCNESCLTSASLVCNCSCAGRNHGISYSG
jgi:hypothetical protein